MAKQSKSNLYTRGKITALVTLEGAQYKIAQSKKQGMPFMFIFYVFDPTLQDWREFDLRNCESLPATLYNRDAAEFHTAYQSTPEKHLAQIVGMLEKYAVKFSELTLTIHIINRVEKATKADKDDLPF